MELLIAHRDAATRAALARVARGPGDDGFDVIESGDGRETLELLLGADAPPLALVDWDLPGVDGPELCRLACQFHESAPPYIILLSHAGEEASEGLGAGASDCVRAPAHGDELKARLEVGRRYAMLLAPHRAEPSLVAECSPFDDADDGYSRGAVCELRSVLVAD